MSKTTNKFSPEVRERAVRLVFETEGQHASRWRSAMSRARLAIGNGAGGAGGGVKSASVIAVTAWPRKRPRAAKARASL